MIFEEIFSLVQDELDNAVWKHPDGGTDMLTISRVSLVCEEALEALQAANDYQEILYRMEMSIGMLDIRQLNELFDCIIKELLQTAAVAIREVYHLTNKRKYSEPQANQSCHQCQAMPRLRRVASAWHGKKHGQTRHGHHTKNCP